MKKKITQSGFRTKKEAELAANKVELSLADGTYIEESKITFGEFAGEWLKYNETRVKVSSIRARRIAMKHLTSDNPNNNKRNFQLLTPKTVSSNRIIKIDERLIPLLKEHRKEQMKYKMKNTLMYNEQYFVFTVEEGFPPVIRKVA